MSLGVRLHRIELLNWGTFDGQDGVHTVTLDGDTTLLVGQNGSGKSTLVDALLTLLVKPGIRNFNVAAGAKKSERDLRTYIRGAYDRNSDGAEEIRVKYLRPKCEQPTVILAAFRRSGSGDVFTVAQLLYVTSDQRDEKVYCFAEADCSIKSHFSGITSADGVVSVLKERGLDVTRTFSEAERWFRRATGTKSKAMAVFNQTVAVKDIKNLNLFIRDHMLEQKNWSEKVDRLLLHYAELSNAHRSLVRVREQSELLEPIHETGTKFTAAHEALTVLEAQLAIADDYFARKTLELFEPDLQRLDLRLQSADADIAELTVELAEVRERKYKLKNDIELAGGERLRQIPALIELELSRAKTKAQRREDYDRALAIAGIETTVDDDRAFEHVRKELPSRSAVAETTISSLELDREQLLIERGRVREELERDGAELETLSKRRNNLPPWCIEVRDKMCRQLGIAKRELPFAAELLMVKTDERAWEASIESVLRGFALTLLVPSDLYRLVSQYVDSTKQLDAHGRGQRLVYIRIDGAGDATSAQVKSMVSKLEVQRDSKLAPWMTAEIARRFDYQCCDTIDELAAATGSAMTQSRHIKSGYKAARHSKDDRSRATNPRNFVLGWDNRDKRRRLKEAVTAGEREDVRLTGKISALGGQIHDLRARQHGLESLGRYATFASINVRVHHDAVAELETERRAIEEASDVIRELRKQLGEAELTESAVQRKRDMLVADRGQCDVRRAQVIKLIANAKTAVEESGEPDMSVHQSIEQEFGGALSVENLFEERERFRSVKIAATQKCRRRLEPLRERLGRDMNRFLNKFPEKQQDLHAGPASLGAFFSLRERIRADDLPRHERRFKERLNEKVITEIALFSNELKQEEKGIKKTISVLNKSLRPLTYRPGQYIELQPQAARDAEIADFRRRLRECVQGSFEESPEANEAKFHRIKELLERLQDDSNRRWRDKVTDVRRWLHFVANVIETESTQRVSSYDDSSGQSGGEKAKLAFTILVASIAYQYDLASEKAGHERFHFVVVDEMFSKVDDQHAVFALELFAQFGLQLLIVAPLDAKARVTEPYVGRYLHVVKRDRLSEIFEMTAKEFSAVSAQAELPHA